MTSDGAARGELSLLGLSRVVTELERSSRGVGVLWPLQGTLHKSRPSLGALNLETSERSSAGLQPSAIRPQPSSLLPHCGQKRYEQNAHTPLSISLILILFPNFIFLQRLIRTFFCFQQNCPGLQTSQTMPLPFLDIQHDSFRYHINRFR